jgi:hypothetical protein
MEVERFKHRQLAPTVGLEPTTIGEFEGPLLKINLLSGQQRVTSQVRRTTNKDQFPIWRGLHLSWISARGILIGSRSVNTQIRISVPHPIILPKCSESASETCPWGALQLDG